MNGFRDEMAVVQAGTFDSCESTSNPYGNWGSSYGTVSVATDQPYQGSGAIRMTAIDAWHAWLYKDAYGYDYWDVRANPTITFYIRESTPVYTEFGIVLGSGSSQWEVASTLVTVTQANTWQEVKIDLTTLVNQVTGGQPDLSVVRRIYIYARNEYTPVTVDVDAISFSTEGALPTPTPTVTPLPTQTSSPSPSSSPSTSQTPTPTFNQPTPTPTSTSPPVDVPVIGKVDQTTLGLSIIIAFTLAAAIFAVAFRKTKRS